MAPVFVKIIRLFVYIESIRFLPNLRNVVLCVINCHMCLTDGSSDNNRHSHVTLWPKWYLIYARFVFCLDLDLPHDDVIKWKHFPCYWPFVRRIHRSPVNSPHKGQWRGAFMFSLICVWINGWVNRCEAGDLWRHRANYDVTVMTLTHITII